MLFVALLAVFPVLAAPPDPVPVGDTWDLSAVYPDEAAWETGLDAIGKQITDLSTCKGTLAKNLRDCLDRRFAVQKEIARAGVYANNSSAADTRDADWRGRSQRASMLANDFDETAAFFEPEIVAMGAPAVDKALAKDPKLAPYAYYLHSALKDAAHTLDPAREAMLARTGDLRDAPERQYTVLVNAELPWPTVELKGQSVRLDPSAYTLWRGNDDRAVRKQVYETFFGALAPYKGTLGADLDAAVQGHWFVAQSRDYPTCVAAALDGDHIPPAVYDTLVAQTNAHLPTLHRYLKLRAKMLGVDDLAYYDLYSPLVQSDLSWTLDQAKALTIDATKPLGPDYSTMLDKGFSSRWMDAYPRQGKASGAYMDGAAYDVHPFLLLNYNGDYESLSTLAHEWGHAGHSTLASAHQPYPTSDYATFIAEIASTFNEALLLDYMLKNAKDDDERLFYLGSALENLRTTYFRQAQFAEFERAIHTQVEHGDPLTGDSLSATYLTILKRYYGADQGITRVDDLYGVEWAYVPHFYYDFYVYQYATSIAASSLLAQDVEDGKPGAVDRYLGLLEAGGSDDPYVLLKNAGVDMATPAPYDAIAHRMDAIMDQIEAILAKKQIAPH